MALIQKGQEAELEVAEIEMFRFSLGVTRMDRIRGMNTSEGQHVRCFRDKVRVQTEMVGTCIQKGE